MSTSTPDTPRDSLMQFFAYTHLPPHLSPIAHEFAEMAQWVVNTLPRNPERTIALRKLLEAKDAAVRSRIYVEPVGPRQSS